MPSPDPKTEDTTQFARVADANGDSALGAAPADSGLAALCDFHGRLIVVPYVGGALVNTAQSSADSGAAGIGLLVKASAGKLYQAWGVQTSGAQLYALLYNIAAGPPAGAPIAAAIAVPNNGNFSMSFGEGLDFSTGIFIALSTTPYTYTAPAAGIGWISALYR